MLSMLRLDDAAGRRISLGCDAARCRISLGFDAQGDAPSSVRLDDAAETAQGDAPSSVRPYDAAFSSEKDEAGRESDRSLWLKIANRAGLDAFLDAFDQKRAELVEVLLEDRRQAGRGGRVARRSGTSRPPR